MCDELARYAVTEALSRGRKFPEKSHPYRSSFERDRDRIIHCSAFRRLEGKTQVFTPGLDDYYRTRLTHSIEVAQIGRTIAKALKLNQDLTEAICLAHDLGHTPFGHTGERILNDLMSEFGGFEHNRQTLRTVELLEHSYPDFPGLNLVYETRLGLAKHRSTYDKPQNNMFSEMNCSLEGQVADIADRIAYNCHDLEDGLRAQVINNDQLQPLKLVIQAQSQIDASSIDEATVRRTRTAKTIIDTLASDCIDATKKGIGRLNIRVLDDVYGLSHNIVVLSEKYDNELKLLESFLQENFYGNKSVLRIFDELQAGLANLFRTLCENPSLMPSYFQKLISDEGLERTVCDYISGMTDRYCLKMLRQIQ